jgi:hypothetical protein
MLTLTGGSTVNATVAVKEGLAWLVAVTVMLIGSER